MHRSGFRLAEARIERRDMTAIHTKTCKACGQEKPLTDFFGPYTDTRTGRQGWKSTCKACLSERTPIRSAQPSKWDLGRERRLRDYPGSKTCTACGEVKPLADFGRPYLRERALGALVPMFNSRCLACQSKAVMARRARRAVDTT
jgi:hypothetical protein